MKQITKNNEPQAILDWKDEACDDWQPTYRDAPKQLYRDSLAAEQGYICCYCNRDISDDDFHIEHFRPQASFRNLEIEYNNLHASCLKNKKPGTPSHCGNAKSNWFDDELTLSPLDNHEMCFKYLDNGLVEAAVPNNTKMISELNLNEEALLAKRKSEIRGWLADEFIDTATNEELVVIFSKISRRENGKYREFVIALQQQIKKLLPENLTVNL
jgi:uncharacterized protein (TIGR02646 family)